MLTATSLEKSFGPLQVLKGVGLEVGSGQVAAIVGPSGAGKTTLLQILGTLENPDKGSITIDGTDPFGLSPRELARFRNTRLGFVFQFHNLLPEFTALENVMMPALITGHSKSKSTPRAKELLDLLGLSHRQSHRPTELSGGEQQRVAVARALMNRPALVLADEPSGNLDTQNAQSLHDLFFHLQEQLGQTFIIVTHNPALSERCHVVVRMKDGRVVDAENRG